MMGLSNPHQAAGAMLEQAVLVEVARALAWSAP
jgi:hypothetical protein